MKRFGLLAVALATTALALATPAAAAEVAGVAVPEHAQVDTTPLVLNGAGLRKKLFFKVYVAALYLPAKSTDAPAIVASPAPRRVVMHLLRDLDADTLYNALLDGLKANHTPEQLGAFKAETAQMETIMRGIGNAKSGDIVGLGFTPEGTTIDFNGTARGRIASPDFSAALLRIWLGSKPIDEDLKRALLGA